MSNVVIAPMLVALVTAILTLVTRARPRLQRTVSLFGGGGYVVAVGVLTWRVFSGPVLTYQLSGWTAPYGITLVADQLAAFMLAMSAVVTIAALAFSTDYIEAFGQQIVYHPLFHLMVVGVTGAFLTGDIFNLFVWFEVMLMPSYVLVVFYSGPDHTRAALQYTVLNLIGSAVMLLAIGGIYATTGTLNMADLAVRLSNPEAFGITVGPVVGLAALLFAVFALKAGIVPFHFWVPSAYEAAPAPVSAMLAGVTKKVGVYAIIRLLFTVFGAAQLDLGPFGDGSMLLFFGPILLVMAIASAFLGGFGAVGQSNLDRLLAYSSIAQVGFIVLPLAIVATIPLTDGGTVAVLGGEFTVPTGAGTDGLRVLGIVAALLYALNHAVAKSLLFLVSGTINAAVGTIETDELGGLTRSRPYLSGAFLIGGLSLVGIPPLMGFFGKLTVFDTAATAMATNGTVGEIAAVTALGGAILTIAYVSKAWNDAFWGTESMAVVRATAQPLALLSIVVVLALVLVVLGIGLDPVYEGAHGAASAALDRGAYIDAVGPSYAEVQS
ncbi:complex I subunit 5 family protein [Halapricum hydrolyticum]|uniref:Proton-conducting transporter membrane subunit n=1 Tax=Halapricum hydrolyticum TaxID=2979991 RepID=A0AAE3LE44_9EURY|nr:proton-conducting transporter membrane subunit [Halapricum hydrolyticum]MCU4716543.1 proton-conducting transporter membrane subunit [Halapricum hydrolyticum]MCU4725852.1 proton-conducting transporter membrane subunit [Halapricum hydrolyticum]